MIERLIVGAAGTVTALFIAVAGIHAVQAVQSAAEAWASAIRAAGGW